MHTAQIKYIFKAIFVLRKDKFEDFLDFAPAKQFQAETKHYSLFMLYVVGIISTL